MTIYTLLDIFWIIFILYWAISSFSAKKTIKRDWKSWGVRLVIFIILVVFSDTKRFHILHAYPPASAPFPFTLQVIGLVLTFLGIALAIWARVYLGTNWGMPMSLKENPELVTIGPYSFIRHPIYTGVLLAMLGSILIVGIEWIIIFILFSLYFIYSAKKEENNMTRQFPNHYPEYKKKTKMLIPFIF